MRLRLHLLAAVLTLAPSVIAAQTGPQVRTIADLGFPGEGYCIDVLGVGATARADLPLVAHNCLPDRGAVDRVVVADADGRLSMPAFDACVTAFGVGAAPLPGVPLVLRPCGGSESFLRAGDLQRFERRGDDRLRLAGTSLCLAVGPDAAPTFNRTHRWRTLTVETCATVDPDLARWAR